MPTRMAILAFSWLPPVAKCGRPAKGHVADNSSAAGAERGGASIERGGSSDDVIDDNHVRASEHFLCRIRRAKCARNVAETVPRCQPRLRLGMSHAGKHFVPYRELPSLTQRAREELALVVAALA